MKKRVEYIDIAKGIGILLVVAGHVYEPEIIRQLIYAFHMPLFLVISGILLNYTNACNKSLLQNMKSKFKGLIIPYIITEVICMVLFYIHNGCVISDWKWIIIDSVFLYYTRGSATWFLLSLFVAEILYLILKKIIHKKEVIFVVCLILFCITFFVRDAKHLLLILLRSFVGMFFIMFGDQWKEWIEKRKKMQIIILTVIIFLASALINPTVSMNDLVFHNGVLYLIESLAGTVLVIELSKKFSAVSGKSWDVLKNIISFYGKNSLIVLCSHLIIMRYGIDVFLNEGPLYGIAKGTIIFLFVLFLEFGLIKAVTSVKFKMKDIRLESKGKEV